MDQNKKRIAYFSHGGGPLPLLGDSGHKAMIDFMRVLPQQIARPGFDPRDQRALGGSHPRPCLARLPLQCSTTITVFHQRLTR